MFEDTLNESMHVIEDDFDNEEYNDNTAHSNYILQTQQFYNTACTGPYDNRWSKTMIGNVDEDTYFVVESTYHH